MIKVVIADDMADTRNGIVKLIQSHFPHYRIDGAFENGTALMEYLDHNVPDLMITDIRMPGCDGLTACRKLRENSVHSNIIIITAYQDFEYAKQAIRFRVHDLITKPYTRQQLIDSIKAIPSTLDLPEIAPVNAQETGIANDMSRAQVFVRKSKDFISANYTDNNLSTTMIANHLHLTPNYLGNIFYRECGYKLIDYIRQTRISVAKELLTDTSLSIHEISTRVGITNIQSFSRLFKEVTGMTPTDYQAKIVLK